MSNKEHLTLAEILLLVAMLLCFIATVTFYIFGMSELFLIFFILHCCLCIGFFLVCQDVFIKAYLDSQEKGASLEEELELLKQDEEELKNLRKTVETLTVANEQLNKNVEELTEQKTALDVELELLKDAPPQIAESNLGHLLPSDENPVNMDIIALTNKVITEMKPYSDPIGLQVILSSSSESITVKADESFIRIMLKNIIDNSIKYMNRTGSLVITISNIGEDLFIVLKDNGDGLSLSETEHIFELNYQGTNRVSGNGLGLSQAKAIVEYYGGTIYAKSGSGKGMGIYIQLPAGSQS